MLLMNPKLHHLARPLPLPVVSASDCQEMEPCGITCEGALVPPWPSCGSGSAVDKKAGTEQYIVN